MSYLALARKWRPSQFNQVVGQAHVLTALENALKQNKLHHAYLFSGTRGVGKTSIGRLFAKGLNCETGITANPCGECDACREIEEGRFVDLLEIDAASRTKVEDTRELLDNVQYKPARGRFKVYLIDEVHMLSRHSFNALLKTLEEPPEYVKFLLATTDPQKLPVTVLSRCLQFHLKPINVDTIHQQLDLILGQEKVSAEPRALGMIAHAADGSMRDALSLTDQAIALGNGSVDLATVSNMLGTLDTDQALRLLEAIAGKNTKQSMDAVQSLAENGVEWDNLLQELASQLHRIAMYQALPASLDKTKPDSEKIELLSQYLSPQDIQLYYQIALKARQDLPLAPTGRMGLEMAVLRMMAFRPARTDTASAIVLPGQEAVSGETEDKLSQPRVQPRPQAEPQSQSQPQAQPRAVPQPDHRPVRQTPQADSPERPPAPPMEQAPLATEDDYPGMADEYAQQMYSSMPEPRHSGALEPAPQSPERTQEQPAEPRAEQPSRVTPRTGLRHQLRSKRASVSATKPVEGKPTKKPEAASSANIIERVARQHSITKPMSPPGLDKTTPAGEQDSPSNEPYQWKPSAAPREQVERRELTPSQIKQALEHTKTPEMTEKLIQEAVVQDEWAALIQKMHTAKLVEQLALNSCYEKQGSTVVLTLRSSHAHLNTDKAQGELLEALNQALGEECHLSVQIGEGGQTPLELREAIYQNKLSAAHDALANDPNIQFIQNRFAAELDSESVRPI